MIDINLLTKVCSESLLSQYYGNERDNELKTFFKYKSNQEKSWLEADNSPVMNEIYGILYNNWLTVQKQPKGMMYIKKSRHNGTEFFCDTLTSGWIFFRSYLTLLVKKSRETERNKYGNLFDFSNGALCASKENKAYNEEIAFQTYLLEESLKDDNFFNTIDTMVSEECKKFLRIYLQPGNMIICSYRFNQGRAGYMAKYDTVDRILWALYRYFNLGKNDAELHKLFTKYTQEATESFKQWMIDSNINTFKDFIDENLLWPFVNEDLKPISMKTGNIIDESIENYDPMPKTISEFETFFRELNARIQERSNLIYEKCLTALNEK